MTSAPAAPGCQRFSAYQLIPPTRADGVTVLPVPKTAGFAGPVLPEAQLELRHNRTIVPASLGPDQVPKPATRLVGAFLWGGQLQGGLPAWVSEFTTRLLPGHAARQGEKILFAGPEGGSVARIPPPFWELLDWFGLPRGQVRFVFEPSLVDQLWIAPQPEQVAGHGPPYQLLDLLAKNTSARGLAVAPSEIVYQSRIDERGQAAPAIIGEAYLCQLLESQGVTVLPQTISPLKPRLAAMARAKALIMADGPNIRLRQLLGYHRQDIIVLPRTPRSRPAFQNLLPRCDRLIYAETSQALLARVQTDGRPDQGGAAALMDADALRRLFGEFGVALNRVWDERAYHDACRVDIKRWVSQRFDRQNPQNAQIDWRRSAEAVRQTLDATGFGDMLAEVEPWLDAA